MALSARRVAKIIGFRVIDRDKTAAKLNEAARDFPAKTHKAMKGAASTWQGLAQQSAPIRLTRRKGAPNTAADKRKGISRPFENAGPRGGTGSGRHLHGDGRESDRFGDEYCRPRTRQICNCAVTR